MYASFHHQHSPVFDSCDISDAESVASLIDSLGNSPIQSINDDWTDNLNNIEDDFGDFEGSIAELFSSQQQMNYSCQQPQQHYDSTGSSLNLPAHYNNDGTMMQSDQQQQQQQQQIMASLPQKQQQHIHHQQQIYHQQSQPQSQPQNMYKTYNNASYMNNYPTPPHSLMDSLMQQTNNAYILNNNTHNNNSFEETYQPSFEEMYQSRIDIFNTDFQNNQMNNAEVFRINQSNMDNRSQKMLLDLIKHQQQQQQQQELLSNQSSPPPTPSSDWADIPSPCSPIKQIKSEYTEKDIPILQRFDSGLSDDIKIPTSVRIGDIKKEIQQQQQPAQQQNKPKRKRNSRKQYTTNSGKPRLYKFLREILEDPATFPCIEWVDKSAGTFKFLDSSEVARLWGLRKNKPSMKYENFARSLRTYIAKGILKKPRNKLVYCFTQPDNE